MTTKIIMSNSAAQLALALIDKSSVTVEAEYGSHLVEGSRYTLAHHGTRKANPPPCVLENADFEEGRSSLEVIGLSHLDLDSIGGVLAVLGKKPKAQFFWECAGYIDTRGAHRLHDALTFSEGVKAQIRAWAAWYQANRAPYPPRDGSCIEVSEYIEKARLAIALILGNDEKLLAEGAKLEEKNTELAKSSFLHWSLADVIVRESESFVNHLYRMPSGKVAAGIASYNPKTKAVTLSIPLERDDLNLINLVQELWGAEAGGHPAIAGGPRSGLDRSELERAAEALGRALQKADAKAKGCQECGGAGPGDHPCSTCGVMHS